MVCVRSSSPKSWVNPFSPYKDQTIIVEKANSTAAKASGIENQLNFCSKVSDVIATPGASPAKPG